MSYIEFQNVCIDFPIYNASAHSLKKRLFNVATGGILGADVQGHVTVQALRDLTFRLNAGDRVGLLGHNGAGKSTLLRLLTGVYTPSSGTAIIHGTTGSLIDISLGIDNEATGRENIYIRGGLLGLNKREITEQMDEIVKFSELGNYIDMPVRTYSTGMHLRLAFAVSTLVRPEILIMDEWLSVGDEQFKKKAEKRLNELVEATQILVIASHDADLVLNTCNRAIWLEHGSMRLFDTAEKVVNNYFGNGSGS